MPQIPLSTSFPLPRGWPRRVRSAVVQVISLARTSLALTQGWASESMSPELRQQAEVTAIPRPAFNGYEAVSQSTPQLRLAARLGSSQRLVCWRGLAGSARLSVGLRELESVTAWAAAGAGPDRRLSVSG